MKSRCVPTLSCVHHCLLWPMYAVLVERRWLAAASFHVPPRPALERFTTCSSGCVMPLLSIEPSAMPLLQPIFSSIVLPLFVTAISGAEAPTTSPSRIVTVWMPRRCAGPPRPLPPAAAFLAIQPWEEPTADLADDLIDVDVCAPDGVRGAV